MLEILAGGHGADLVRVICKITNDAYNMQVLCNFEIYIIIIVEYRKL